MDNWNKYFMEIASKIATRSHCLSRQEGAILIKNNRIVATGYNGPASGVKHCDICKRYESGKDLFECAALHAEENAILQCALNGPSTIGTTLYTTLQPCNHCMKMIIQAKIEKVYYMKSYKNHNTDTLTQMGIECIQME